MSTSRERNARFRADFCRRTRVARESAGLTQHQMADALGIPRDHYSKYESRSQLPLPLIPKFLEITGMDAWVLLTGKARNLPKASEQTQK